MVQQCAHGRNGDIPGRRLVTGRTQRCRVTPSIFNVAIAWVAVAMGFTARPTSAAQQTFNITASGNDGGPVSVSSYTYPPGSCASPMLTATTNTAKPQFNSPNYSTAVIALGFDSSALGPNVTITSAQLNLYVTAASNPDSRNLTGDYFDWGTAIDCADWTSSYGSGAFSVGIGTLTTNAYNAITLTNPNANINKTGMTKFRL